MYEDAVAVLHGYDTKTKQTTTDVFEFDAEKGDMEGKDSPAHRARLFRDSVAEDFPDTIWTVGRNFSAKVLDAFAARRIWGFENYSLDDARRVVEGMINLYKKSGRRNES